MEIPERRWAWVKYVGGGPRGPWHQLWIIGRNPGMCDSVVRTPDGDIYVENYGGQDTGIDTVIMSPDFGFPFGVSVGFAYPFRGRPSMAQITAWWGKGATVYNEFMRDQAAARAAGPAVGAAGDERAGAGVGSAGGGDTGGAETPRAREPEARPSDETWVLIEDAGGQKRGTPVLLVKESVVRGSVALVQKADGTWLAARRLKPSEVADFVGSGAGGHTGYEQDRCEEDEVDPL